MALCMEISVLNNSIEIMYLHCFKLADFMIKKKKNIKIVMLIRKGFKGFKAFKTAI